MASARGGFYHVNIEDTGIPFFDLIHNYSTGSVAGFVDRHPEIPPAFQQGAGWLSDNLQTGVRAFDTYERTACGVDGTWYFKGAGDHSLKFGYQNEEIYQRRPAGLQRRPHPLLLGPLLHHHIERERDRALRLLPAAQHLRAR